jgi:DNA-binding XRE family transcriptional regulator
MPVHEDNPESPIGTSASEASRRRAARSAEYRMEQERLAAPREIARQLTLYRTRAGLTQRQLAALVGTSYSQISRLESGQHMPTYTTLQRIADALNLTLRLTFEERKAG